MKKAGRNVSKNYIFYRRQTLGVLYFKIIGPLNDSASWYKITHAGAPVALWEFQNKATHTSPP